MHWYLKIPRFDGCKTLAFNGFVFLAASAGDTFANIVYGFSVLILVTALLSFYRSVRVSMHEAEIAEKARRRARLYRRIRHRGQRARKRRERREYENASPEERFRMDLQRKERQREIDLFFQDWPPGWDDAD